MANTTGLKFGGRKLGTPNRTTKETKDLLQNIVNNEIDSLGEMLEKLEPLERVNAIAKLLPYIIPKTSEIFLKESEPPRKIIIKIPRRTNE